MVYYYPYFVNLFGCNLQILILLAIILKVLIMIIMRTKGITLPVNSVIIIALAVMVLLILAVFFVKGTGNINKTELENAWTACCSTIQTIHHCNTNESAFKLSDINPGYDINSNGTTENCEQICRMKFGLIADHKKCVCACPGCCT